MAKTSDQKAAIKKREKLAEPVEPIDPMAQPEAHVPKPGTSARFFWEYGQAYARGIAKATGRPSTPPVVPGPRATLVQAMITHARDVDGKQIRGAEVLRWLEDVVCDFRTHADERDYGRGVSQWSPAAFARWLDNGRPKAFAAHGTASAERRAHIAVKRV